MRKKIHLMAAFLVIICLLAIPAAAQAPLSGKAPVAAPGPVAPPGPLAGKTVVLDPGHGGAQAGAFYYGVREADVNLAIALKLRDKLAAAGARVVMTRATDQLAAPPRIAIAAELQARVDIAKAVDADIFVSVHSNAHDKEETNGAITFYAPGRPTDLARAIQEGLILETGAVNKGVRPANFYVLRNSDIPAVLVEVGFMSNRTECSRLADPAYQEEAASGIFKGIVRYFLAP